MDCFQEQQAAVAIYSMTSSSPEEAPWAMEGPCDRHRLTVATSRPWGFCVLVGNPARLNPSAEECRLIRLHTY